MDRLTPFDAIRGRLPSLYRPETGDRGLLSAWLRAVADEVVSLDVAAGDLLLSRWLAEADSARFSSFVARGRALAGLPPLDPADAADRLLIERHPHLRDLGRLGSLLGVPPWREPAFLRESVEAYRLRLRRIVALYRDGLGTAGALRRMVEAQLPVDLGAPPARVDPPFWIEEPVALAASRAVARPAGEPLELVGPLMPFTLASDALAPSAPTVYLEGQTPEEGVIDATEDPLLERLPTAGTPALPIGLGVRVTVPPGQTLRLRPAASSWLIAAGGLLRADRDPGTLSDRPLDATAPGPWAVADDPPPGTPRALVQGPDRVLWLAAEANDGEGSLWRYDGGAWQQALAGLPAPRSLAVTGDALWLGSVDGLRRLALYPEDGTFVATPVAGLEGRAIEALAALHEVPGTTFVPKNGTSLDLLEVPGTVLAGTDRGLFQVAGDGAAAAVGLGAGAAPDADAARVQALYQDAGGSRFYGTDRGLVRHRPAVDDWHGYTGGTRDEQAGEWQPLDAAAAGPDPAQVFLPPVRAIARGHGGDLWLGTARGVARYVARGAEMGRAGLAFDTRLEAYPELGEVAVHDLARDARGLLWLATGRGLLRHDGRDFWQHADGAWQRFGNLDRVDFGDAGSGGGRGSWRFRRSSPQADPAAGVWERFDARLGDWRSPALDPVTSEQEAVQQVVWTDRVIADLGIWDGDAGTFEALEAVPPAQLVMRVKPSPTRIVDGGLPALPRLPGGTSSWRYLALEPADFAPPPAAQRPAWSREGRLLPPPAAPTEVAAGRFDVALPPPARAFDQTAFAFCPAARVTFVWRPRRPFGVLVRLLRRGGAAIDPAILDRVWQGMNQVRPAGVHTLLAVEDDIVRGDDHG